MKYISILIIIFAFIKSICYGKFELEKQKNKLGGYGVYFLSILGLLVPITVIFIFY